MFPSMCFFRTNCCLADAVSTRLTENGIADNMVMEYTRMYGNEREKI